MEMSLAGLSFGYGQGSDFRGKNCVSGGATAGTCICVKAKRAWVESRGALRAIYHEGRA